MNAKKCDICGAFYPCPMCNDAVRIYIDLGHSRDRYADLCGTCYDKLCLFVAPALPKDYSVERYGAEKIKEEKDVIVARPKCMYCKFAPLKATDPPCCPCYCTENRPNFTPNEKYKELYSKIKEGMKNE